MKTISILLSAVILFTSCQKNLKTPESINGDPISSDGAIVVDTCHATSFSTDYAAVAGKTPPFKFTKTQYASGRIRTINMLSRANPNHSNFKEQAWEVVGTFTYWSDKARLVGTKQLWEYYKTSTGAAAKKSIIKKNIDLTFTFGRNGDALSVEGDAFNKVYEVRNNLEGRLALTMKRAAYSTYSSPLLIHVLAGSDEPDNYFEAQFFDSNPAKMIITSHNVQFGPVAPSWGLRKTITFNYNPAVKRERLYQPTQNWISMEYNICEVMNWVGHGGVDGTWYNAERSSVEVKFYPYNNSTLSTQSQVYKNHRYLGNKLLSYTFSDNVLQKNIWNCK